MILINRNFYRTNKKLIFVAGALIAVVLVSWIKPDHQSKPDAPTTSTQASVGSSQENIQIPGPNQNTAIGQSSQASSPAQPPNFTVYYPVNPPSPQVVDKSTIAYSKNSFSFNIQQNGQDQFFVEEQPAGNNFSYQRLKVRLGSPKETDTPLGKGVIGTIGTNFITAVNTSKNTLIIVNCTALQCGGPSAGLLGSMKINNDPTHIK